MFLGYSERMEQALRGGFRKWIRRVGDAGPDEMAGGGSAA